jgi:phage terminase Nu1 subunit (DNA packaging protein)
MVELANKLPKSRLANKAEVAEFFGVSLPTVEAWLRRGAPYIQKGSKGISWQIDLLEVARWKFAPDTGTAEDPADLPPKDRLDHYKAEREKTKHLEEQGHLLQAHDVEQTIATTYKAIAQAIETFPDQAEREHGATPDVVAILQGLGDKLREALYGAATQ